MKIGDKVYIPKINKIGVIREIKKGRVSKVEIPPGEIIDTILLVVRIIRITDYALQIIVPIFKKYWRKIWS